MCQRQSNKNDASTMMTPWQWQHNGDSVTTTTTMIRTMTTWGPRQQWPDNTDDTTMMTPMTWQHDNDNMTMQWQCWQCDDEVDEVMTIAWRWQSQWEDNRDGDDVASMLQWHNNDDMATTTMMVGWWWHGDDDDHDNKTMTWWWPREHFSVLLCVRWGVCTPKPHLAEAEGVFSLMLGCFGSRS